jgi:hypothetical protein
MTIPPRVTISSHGFLRRRKNPSPRILVKLGWSHWLPFAPTPGGTRESYHDRVQLMAVDREGLPLKLKPLLLSNARQKPGKLGLEGCLSPSSAASNTPPQIG